MKAATALLCLPFLITHSALAEDLDGRIVRVIDGDTLELLTAENQPVRIRLAEIDAPERQQPYGARAKQALSALTFGQTARVEVIDHDRYGRTIGRVHAGGLDVNAELVREGAAWIYIRYSKDATLIPLEAEARAEHRGLWSLPDDVTMPPWEWRRAKRESRSKQRNDLQPAVF